MGFLDRLFAEVHVPDADGVRVLDVPSAMNLRDLGGYETPDGPTVTHRFLRCGSTRCMSQKDRAYLRSYGLTHVLDLRGSGESPELTCPYARERSVVWKNVPLLGHNLSDPVFAAAQHDLDYLSRGYVAMLENHETIRQAVSFLATVPHDECALFHCAAGMDRTGVTAMLLLGAAGVSRTDIVRDSIRLLPCATSTALLPRAWRPTRLLGAASWAASTLWARCMTPWWAHTARWGTTSLPAVSPTLSSSC